MVANTNPQDDDEGIGISNRGKKIETPAQEFVKDSFEVVSDQNSAPQPDLRDARVGRDVDIDGDDGAWLSPEQQSGGERHISNRDGQADHSHH